MGRAWRSCRPGLCLLCPPGALLSCRRAYACLFAEWTLAIQTMELSDEHKFDFDPLDVTKTWPEDLFPLQPVGRMVLNRNPDNFFNENEQVRGWHRDVRGWRLGGAAHALL